MNRFQYSNLLKVLGLFETSVVPPLVAPVGLASAILTDKRFFAMCPVCPQLWHSPLNLGGGWPFCWHPLSYLRPASTMLATLVAVFAALWSKGIHIHQLGAHAR